MKQMMLLMLLLSCSFSAYIFSYSNSISNLTNNERFLKQRFRRALVQCTEQSTATFLKNYKGVIFSEDLSFNDDIQEEILWDCNDIFASYVEIANINAELAYEDYIIFTSLKVIKHHNDLIRQEIALKR